MTPAMTTDFSATLISIALFGALGAISRYFCSYLPDYMGIPMGTATVNIVGSLLLGLSTSIFLVAPYPGWFKTGLTTGFLGAFTTFSTFSVDNAKLIQDQSYIAAGVNILGQLILGVTMALLGLYLGTKWFQN